MKTTPSGLPPKQGLYDPGNEKDSCGLGFVANIAGHKSHAIVQEALTVLSHLFHRGAQGFDSKTGDGAGIQLQVPHEFFEAELKAARISLPYPGRYGVGMFFLPQAKDEQNKIQSLAEKISQEEGCKIIHWRDVPVRSEILGPSAQSSQPKIKQAFLTTTAQVSDQELRRKLYVIRRRIEHSRQESVHRDHADFSISSFSSRTIVYKGLLLPDQVGEYYPDLGHPDLKSALAMVHSRFSTNTFPTWARAHPYHYLCHNGEINTIQGNVSWMHARQDSLKSKSFGGNIRRIFPIVDEGQSDSACLDNALEFLVMGGRSLPHSVMMLIPEPWVANSKMDLDRRGFYEYHSAMMEPWDGPAAVCFTDGEVIGATLDRNGLRPCRYIVTDDGKVILSSEAGVLPVDPQRIAQKGRLEPGKMFLVDTVQGRIISDEEIKSSITQNKPYRAWVTENRVSLDELPEPLNVPQPDHATLRPQQKTFGYTTEALKMILTPMAVSGEEPTSSMGNDTPLAVFSQQPQVLFKYFRQHFAQVTNPPIDPIREQLVMSLSTNIGPRPNLLEEKAEIWRRIKIQQPILTNSDLEKIRALAADPYFKSKTLQAHFRASLGPNGLRAGLVELCREAAKAVRDGYRFIILSDRGVDSEWAPIPSLLAISAVHHHLVRKSKRSGVGLIVESGEPYDVHHFACLIGYGAGSVNPYLAFDTLADMARHQYFPEGIDAQTAQDKYIKAVGKGLLKIFSKMGISTVQSYCGAQIFEAIGLNHDVVDRYFTGTPTAVSGIGLTQIASDVLARHKTAYSPFEEQEQRLPSGGDIHYRVDGEKHFWNPTTIAKLQHATRTSDPKTFQEFSDQVNLDNRSTLRGQLDFNFSQTPVALDEVEPAAEIVKRFTTGAMSFGALGKEAHETLAVAMNRIGAKSNSGEGGEDAERFVLQASGDSKNSAIKQIASARFGVTAHYLVNARELQIKMAQGAKPGEGGQLPGHKVDAAIARMRYSKPGVTLISPPPHHDIYSIEDLAQLIFDLKNTNPRADVSVKLVAKSGVGTIAAGVVKAHADKVLISGDSGGTGASPLSSIKYAGGPWELGLAETQQTLVLNRLRGRVRVEVDGQLKNGRDVVIASLLGAEEFGFSTAPLIVEGCIMMRKCHLNTCPVGVATQDPELRKRFTGKPEHVIQYFFFIAEEVRQLMAQLGYRKFEEMIGQVGRLKTVAGSGLDLAPLLYYPMGHEKTPRRWIERQNHALETILDHQLIKAAQPAFDAAQAISARFPIKNTNRATGSMLSGEIARKFGAKGLPKNSIHFEFAGSAGQSFGAFLAPGLTLKLTGESNDYVGKGLSGGKIVICPPGDIHYDPSNTVIIGNTALYGATQGEAYIYGRSGERFAVRNSGATAVIEGTGDHGCEYMTGGTVVVLGRTGRNFAAGMSGGLAFVLNEDGEFESRCNLGMVELLKVSDKKDQALLKQMITEHFQNTGSSKAKKILNDWEAVLLTFVKVKPLDG